MCLLKMIPWYIFSIVMYRSSDSNSRRLWHYHPSSDLLFQCSDPLFCYINSPLLSDQLTPASEHILWFPCSTHFYVPNMWLRGASEYLFIYQTPMILNVQLKACFFSKPLQTADTECYPFHYTILTVPLLSGGQSGSAWSTMPYDCTVRSKGN